MQFYSCRILRAIKQDKKSHGNMVLPYTKWYQSKKEEKKLSVRLFANNVHKVVTIIKI